LQEEQTLLLQSQEAALWDNLNTNTTTSYSNNITTNTNNSNNNNNNTTNNNDNQMTLMSDSVSRGTAATAAEGVGDGSYTQSLTYLKLMDLSRYLPLIVTSDPDRFDDSG
jgi:hypothetical protein